ncbi:SNF2 helicase associated domain-containing protein [Tissierella sp. Yu-01]|uniref:DEAD/DEAH box helicase n=1 Tax=Tissierella sp. Yu-01 TaxID=3035694 RepID=UPI00240E6014|nr:SNF2 helicase associated domain-containing protein [Tissierella sp. Yu-01]WFA08438.1 SNF2 helicase associated domain-containing protein [Tissierella sp. Yu-01]
MLNISDDILIGRVEFYETFLKGKTYNAIGRVREVKTNPERDLFVAKVVGTSTYEPTIRFNSFGNILHTSCTCQAFKKLDGDCKHVIALLITIRELDRNGMVSNKKTEGDLSNIIQKYRENRDVILTPVNLEINCEIDDMETTVNLKIGEERLYVVKSMAKFLSNIIDNNPTEFSKNFIFLPDLHYFKDEDKEFIEFLKLLYENYEYNYNPYYNHGYTRIFSGKKLRLNPITEEKFFDLMINRKLNLTLHNNKYLDIDVTSDKLEFHFNIKENKNDLILDIDENVEYYPITESGRFFFYNNRIYRLSNEQIRTIMPLYNEVKNKDIKKIRIKDDLKETFISEVLPSIKKHSTLKIDENVKNSIYNPNLYTTMYFDRVNEMIFGTVLFNYGEIQINPFSSVPIKKEPNKILLRDIETEGRILSLLEESDFKVENGGFFLEEEELIFDFINDIVPQLQNYCEIFYSDSFRRIGLVGAERFSGGIKLNTGMDMLEFNFDIEGIDASELNDVFNALREKKRYYKLKDGSFLSLESNELEDIIDILDYLDVGTKGLIDGKLKIPKYRTMYLDKLLKDKEINFIKKNIDFKRLVRDINEPDDIEYEIPKDLNAKLRDYQIFGFKWLKTLSKYGFGGILADEMGLGKTLQMITFLLSEKDENNDVTSVVVVPTSLVFNWEEEVGKFAPGLKTLVVTGTKEERNELIKNVKDYDLIITSYPLMRRDIEEYQDITFEYCILDEAQHIKNHSSLNAKSVKNINAKQYFALTGTPMENSLSELWSIFDYLMPGYLSSYGKFSMKYERPITKDQDSGKLRDLNNHIKPFILRRLKKDVLKELPDKIEQKILVDMSEEQKKIYLAYLQAIKGEISAEINMNGFNKSHIKILAGLTRLRQICCHPGIFLEDYKGHSGKLESLEEIIEEALNGNHRILIFSQFTTMLQRIRDSFESRGIDYLYLDGSTPIYERGELVRNFNNGQGDIFLISLKAGGTGLNLTSADMVIHYDPWWNPAVEDQATDRAHRIGQENKVQVIKLITKGTIEEKIFQLQEQKKEMIDKVIREGETLISKLSEEEIMSLFMT